MKKMEKFHVIGDYGPLADDNIIRNYVASSPKNAEKMFIARIKRDSEYLWSRMGKGNVHVFAGWWR